MTEEFLSISAVVLTLILQYLFYSGLKKQDIEIKERHTKFKEEVDQLLNKIEDEKTKINKHKDCKKCSVYINKEFE